MRREMKGRAHRHLIPQRTSGKRILSDGKEEEEEEEILNKETLDSIKDLKEAMDSEHVDVKYILDRLHAFINNLESGNQQLKTEAPPKQHANRFDELINKHMSCIVDRLVAIKKTGIPKQLPKLTAKLLEGVGERNSVLVGVSFLGWLLNRGFEILENDEICTKFLEYIKCLLNVLRSHKTSLEGDTPFDPPFKFVAQDIINGILVCCSYLEGNVAKRFLSVSSTQDDLKQVSEFLDRAIRILQLQLQLKTPYNFFETNQHFCAVEAKLESQRTMQCNVPQSVHADSIGIDDRIKEVIRLLKMDDKDVKRTAVILHGFAGIGKSTIACEVIDALKPWDFGFSFVSVFLDFERTDFETQAIELQSRIISQLACKEVVVDSIRTGQTELTKVLSSGHCFIFVDNVVEGRQLRGVFPQDLPDKQRLRILVTSRDLNVSKEIPVDNHYRKVYAVDSLPYSPSLLLLKKSVGIKDDGDEIFVGELQKIEKVAKLCHGVPLSLVLVGRDLKSRRRGYYYDDILEKLTSAAADLSSWELRKIFDLLLSSFKLLDESVQIAFLDICVFFIGKKWGRVCEIVGKRAMDALIERCFIKRDVDNCVSVHGIMRYIAVMLAEKVKNRFIINLTENGSDTSFMDLSRILGEDVKDTQIEGLFIYGTECQTISIRPGNLPSLRLFEASGITVEFKDDEGCTTFRELQYFSLSQPKHKGVVQFLFKDRNPLLPIEVLSLHGMEDLHELPRGLWRMRNLKVLEITSYRNLESLPPDLTHLDRLEQLNLEYSEMLNCLPEDLEMLTSLEELILRGCSHLQALPDSICWSHCLKKLDMAGCASISSLPEGLGQLKLEELILTGCSRLQALPDSICWSHCLKKLDMAGCASISSLPKGLGLEGLEKSGLEELILTGCTSLEALPDSICLLQCLKKLDMAGCASISSLPEGLGRPGLEELILTGCSGLQALPNSICLLQCLKKLDMASCVSISSLPNALGQLGSLEILDLSSCSNLEGLPSDLSGLVSLKELNLKNCRKFKALPAQLRDIISLEKLIFTKSKKATYGGFWKHIVPS